MSKFKVGDKVKILLSATCDGVNPKDVGMEGVVIDAGYQNSLKIQMSHFATRSWWYVNSDNVTLIVKVGEQLLFAFMSEEE